MLVYKIDILAVLLCLWFGFLMHSHVGVMEVSNTNCESLRWWSFHIFTPVPSDELAGKCSPHGCLWCHSFCSFSKAHGRAQATGLVGEERRGNSPTRTTWVPLFLKMNAWTYTLTHTERNTSKHTHKHTHNSHLMSDY